MTVALEMFRSVPRTLAGKAMGSRMPGILSGFAAPLRVASPEAPKATGKPGWARLRTRLSGICGSDLGMLSGRTSLYFSAVVSLPFTPGHEVVADLVDDCEDLPAGTRVVVDPVLTCAARGVESCEACAVGATNRCSRITVGHLSPGLQTGFCADTGGGWGQQLVAHRSQLHPVPDALTDEQAVLVEPIACAVHTALRAGVQPGDRVLVSGAGAVGLLATLALRELTPAAEVLVVAKHPLQKEIARLAGATDVVAPSEVLRRVRRSTGAFQLRPEFSRPYLLGGVDVAIDAVGSAASLETAMGATRAGGRVVVSGMPAPANLSALWFRELELVGTYASARTEASLTGPDGAERGSFDAAVDLAAHEAVAAMADSVARYPLHRWREAIDHAHSAGRLGTVKVAFSPGSRS
ncbi:zinc-dependent alcohol dehydrogenase [Nocardioides bruguierae]|uniref:Alcohol dehydrogenase catalytic domain-containing protein n=1 Tax=Nocardioides bruguierae TaxID=2945102 RepID=A0A9X2D504_9ACTN|nr:alcohol dehydrogenase catalytic domain-containing protein [Nocardioides bruguierae]MCM0619423.1 alcohol dehydrogenase catalytic domain-containing protein [Nocardioides bruguierae]